MVEKNLRIEKYNLVHMINKYILCSIFTYKQAQKIQLEKIKI